jgi:hypothetical protein
MGTFHKEISIERGLKGRVKNRGVSKKKQGGRTVDEMHVVYVRDMPMGPAAGGRLVVRSSNVMPEIVLGAGWSKGARERIDTRLRDSNGDKKGRVLYGVLECMNQEPTVACVLCYHIERAGRIVVKSVEATSDLTSHRAVLFDGLFRCAEHIACEHSEGKRADLEFEVSKEQASWYRDTFDFRDVRRSAQKSTRILGRNTEGCRTKAKRADRARSQQAATR